MDLTSPNIFEIPSWSRISNPIHYWNNNGTRLIVTVGDSWTYGDSLGKTRVRDGVDDEKYRLSHVYGKLLAEKLKSDWMNIALPGGSNTLMLTWLRDYLAMFNSTDRVTCVITLTESGRHEDLRLIDRDLVTQQAVLEKILSETYAQVTWLRLQYPSVKFVVAHNFTDSIQDFAVEKSWLEVMLGKKIQNGTHIVVSEHIAQMNYEERFPDVLDIMTKAVDRLNLLDNCDYCCNQDSRHPLEEGHAMWAEYLLTQI